MSTVWFVLATVGCGAYEPRADPSEVDEEIVNRLEERQEEFEKLLELLFSRSETVVAVDVSRDLVRGQSPLESLERPDILPLARDLLGDYGEVWNWSEGPDSLEVWFGMRLIGFSGHGTWEGVCALSGRSGDAATAPHPTGVVRLDVTHLRDHWYYCRWPS